MVGRVVAMDDGKIVRDAPLAEMMGDLRVLRLREPQSKAVWS